MESPPSSRKPDWLALLPEPLALALILGAVSPAIYAIFLLHESRLALGIAILVLWLVPFAALLVHLRKRRVVRLVISIPCTIAVLAVTTVVVSGVI